MRRQTMTSSGWRFWATVGAFALAFGAVAIVPDTSFAQQIDDPTDGEIPGGSDEASGSDDKGSDEGEDKTDQVEKRLVFALSGYHAFPTRAELDAIADADTITRMLRRFATSTDQRPSMRTRAVDALGYYDDAETREFLEALIEEPSSSGASERVADLMRHHAITSLAKAHGDAAVETLAPLLDSDDFQIKMTTVVALAKHGGAQAKKRLRALREETDDRMIRREIDKYVGNPTSEAP